MIFLRASLLWLAFLAMAILAGTLRQFLLAPAMGDTPARAACTVLLCVLYFAAIRAFVMRLRIDGISTRLFLGLFWSGLTLAFEFGFGLARGLSWDVMLADYNMLEGRLWPLVPLTLLAAPLLSRRKTQGLRP